MRYTNENLMDGWSHGELYRQPKKHNKTEALDI